MNRLEDFCKLLDNIYGKEVVSLFTTQNDSNDTLSMNKEAHNQKSIKDYKRKDGEGCEICYMDFRNKETFFKRNLEFPGWVEKLNFSKTNPAKRIMIIGEAPPPLVEQINIAFGLGYLPIERDGNLNFVQLRKTYKGEEKRVNKIISNQTKKNKLWVYLNLLFSDKLNKIKPMIYLTDLCKCNDDNSSGKNEKIWKKCRDNYLIKEIALINPSLIIFQGWSSYVYLRDYLKCEKIIKSEGEILQNVELINKRYYREEVGYSKKSLYYNPFYGKLPFNGKHIPFFIIFHQSNFTNQKKKKKYNRTDYINRHSEFVKEKILSEVLNLN